MTIRLHRALSASQRVFRGTVAGQDAIIKLDGQEHPWQDPRSAFYGGAGIVPPFCPLVHHEAAAWKRLSPERLLFVGFLDGCATIALKPVEGEPLRPWGPDRTGDFLRAAAKALLRLHRAGIVHRDLRPANLLQHGPEVRIIDLDLALVDGLGPAGSIASRGWAAPELDSSPGGWPADLFALGRLAHWSITADLSIPIPTSSPHHALITALCDPDPTARPRDLVAVLKHLGVRAPMCLLVSLSSTMFSNRIACGEIGCC